MTKFEFDFKPTPEPKKLKLSLPADLYDFYEKEAISLGGTMEKGIVQALGHVRKSMEEPEVPPQVPPSPKVRNRKKPTPAPSLAPEV